MCAPLAAVAAVAGIAGSAYSVYSAERAASAQGSAARKAQAQAKAQQAENERAINAANRKTPDIGGALSRAASPGGVSGTLLTGGQGAPLGQIGRPSLLGL